jgi:hypothetical protein
MKLYCGRQARCFLVLYAPLAHTTVHAIDAVHALCRCTSPCALPEVPGTGCRTAPCAAAKGHLQCLRYWTEECVELLTARQCMLAHCDPSVPMEGPSCDPLSDASVAGLAASYGHYACLAYALEKGYHLDRSLINFCASETCASLRRLGPHA